MKRHFILLTLALLGGRGTNAQVYLNEFFANPAGADSSATVGLEYFELRGTPSLALSGYYLLSLEGQGTTGRGDINQFFDLGGFSIGASGYLFAQQFGSPYSPVAAGAVIVSNSISQGWGQVNGVSGSSAGHSSDGAQLDVENSATTILLINIGIGSAPALTTDLDADDDGLLELPVGWSIIDSVGIMDGVTAGATDFSYGTITLRAGGVGTNVNGNIVDVPAGAGTGFYVGRIGESTGSTAADWFGSIISGSAGNFTLSSASDGRFTGRAISDMGFGGTNPVPEPATIGLLSLGLAALWMIRRRR